MPQLYAFCISPLDCQGDQVVNDQGVCACPDGQVDDGQENGNCIAGK